MSHLSSQSFPFSYQSLHLTRPTDATLLEWTQPAHSPLPSTSNSSNQLYSSNSEVSINNQLPDFHCLANQAPNASFLSSQSNSLVSPSLGQCMELAFNSSPSQNRHHPVLVSSEFQPNQLPSSPSTHSTPLSQNTHLSNSFNSKSSQDGTSLFDDDAFTHEQLSCDLHGKSSSDSSSHSSSIPTLSSTKHHPPSAHNNHPMRTRAKDHIHKPVIKLGLNTINSAASTTTEPTSLSQALKYPKWRAAISDEFNALLCNGIRTPVPPDSSQNLIGCKLVFRIKRNPNGSIDCYKAHLVAEDFHQRPASIIMRHLAQLSSQQQFD